jgi:hypothetical protein
MCRKEMDLIIAGLLAIQSQFSFDSRKIKFLDFQEYIERKGKNRYNVGVRAPPRDINCQGAT